MKYINIILVFIYLAAVAWCFSGDHIFYGWLQDGITIVIKYK